MHTEVYDSVPPLSIFHSRFFNWNDYEKLLGSIRPLTYLEKKLKGDDGYEQQNEEQQEARPSLSDSSLRGGGDVRS